MSEWWTYTPADFLLFAPRTYWRLFELYNAAVWPAQLVAIALGAGLVVLACRDDARTGRWMTWILAALWAWVAFAFHFRHYATINWIAPWFAVAFALEAVLLASFAGRLQFGDRARVVWRGGLGIFMLALAILPFVGPLAGRPWTQLQLFGIAPDPTALATLGLLLAARRPCWILWIVPLAWCAVSGLTLWTMEAPDFWVLPAGAIVALAVALTRRRGESKMLA